MWPWQGKLTIMYCGTHTGKDLSCGAQVYDTQTKPILTDTCTIATSISGPCGATVAQLKAIVKAQDDPTRIAHNALTCIAAGACGLRCNMKNCDWLKEVIPLMSAKYLSQVDGWPAIIAKCQARGQGSYNDLLCLEEETRRLSATDLRSALIASGCGSEQDWQKVYGVIKTCTGESVEQLLPGALANTNYWAPYGYRAFARTACITTRGIQNPSRPIEINPNLQGQTCTP